MSVFGLKWDLARGKENSSKYHEMLHSLKCFVELLYNCWKFKIKSHGVRTEAAKYCFFKLTMLISWIIQCSSYWSICK